MSDGAPAGADPADESPLRRTLDLCLFAPVGVAASVVEDLPHLIAKGRRRVELQIGNALVVGRFVVTKGQHKVASHLGELFGTARDEEGLAGRARAPAPPTPRPAPDSDAAVIVAGALADYDTLSASQVVRRLESLDPNELRAVQRYEASTRNRRTILVRAEQLLEHPSSGPTLGPD